MKMTSQFRQKLRGQAHGLKPVIMIGRAGLTEAVQLEIEKALLVHELIKIRISNQESQTLDDIIQKICKDHQAELIQTIGHIVVIYREKEE